MAKVEHTSGSVTSPAWAGDFLDRDSLMPGGARVDPAGFTADSKGRKPIASGTLLGRTYAERDAKTGFGPAVATDDEIYLLAFDVTDAVFLPDCELYRPKSLVKENLIPDWVAMSAELKAKIRSLYTCSTGAE